MTHCLQVKIETLLNSGDEALKNLFYKDPSVVRKALEAKKAAGEVYVPSAGCEGFDPVKGCPGHETDSKTN